MANGNGELINQVVRYIAVGAVSMLLGIGGFTAVSPAKTNGEKDLLKVVETIPNKDEINSIRLELKEAIRNNTIAINDLKIVMAELKGELKGKEANRR